MKHLIREEVAAAVSTALSRSATGTGERHGMLDILYRAHTT